MNDTQNLSEILKLVLNAENLQQYYHLDECPERKPVRIATGPQLKSTPEFEKFGAPVVYQSREELEQKKLPYFEFLKIAITPDKAEVRFRYAVEGVVGNADLVHGNEGWQMDRLVLSEED